MSSGFSWSFYHLDIMSDSATDPRPGQSVARALSVLDLFDGEHAIWSAEGICAALRCPLPTGYRYLRELVAAGLVRRVAGGFGRGFFGLLRGGCLFRLGYDAGQHGE